MVTDEKKVLRIGHRGAPSFFLENTIASIQKAVEVGVDMVEFDIRRTLDDQFVLWHSSRFGRFFDVSSRVARKKIADLMHVRGGDGQPIALLQDAIDAVKGLALMNIDLKSSGGEEGLVDLIVRKGVEKDVLISSHHTKSLRKIKELEPRIHTGISLPKDRFHLSILEDIWPVRKSSLFLMRRMIRYWGLRSLEKARADALMLYYELLSPGLVQFFQTRGVPVYAYTVDDEGAMEKVASMGVHGIASNRPELFQEV
ncbi:MAG: glycerophosphodiester phosphodiesterase [Candidatus Eisenbacteria bacterium]